nr:hypothetical protein [uncultured Carboxylicivirga sp.]
MNKMKLMQTKYIKLVLVGLAFVSFNLYAQEEINKDVKVVREYTPTVSDAFKVNQMPDVNDSVTLRPSFNYRIISTSVNTDYKPTLINPAKIQTEQRELLLKSYVKGGVGNYNTLLGELGYNILESEPFLLGLNIGHASSFGKLKLEDGESVDAPMNDTYSNLGFKHFFDDKTLSVDLNFLHNIYHYYGYQTLVDETDYYLPGSTDPVLGSVLMQDERQRLSAFDMLIGLQNNVSDDNKTVYNANFGFSSFGNVTGVKQNGFMLNGVVRHPVNDLIFSLEGKVQSFKTSVPDTIGPMYTFADRKLTYIEANPAVHFNFDNINVKVGMVIGGQIDSEDDQFFVAPDILAKLTVVEGIVALYGGLNGNMNINDYCTSVYENPFLSPDANIKSSMYGLNLFAGIEGNFSSSTSFSAGIEYSFFNDEHFYVNKYYSDQSETSSSLFTYHYSNLFVPVYDDGNLLKVKGELLYRPKKEIELLLHGAYNGWNLDSEAAAWHKPEVEFGLKASLNLNEFISLNGSIGYLGERKAYDRELDDLQKTLSGVFDMNLGGEYRFSRQWTFWTNVNNIAASKYYQWNGYPSQRLNVQAGIIYTF